MINQTDNPMLAQYELDLGTIHIHANFAVGKINYGTHIDTSVLKHYSQIMIDTHFPNKPFGYISLRTNSYSIDPHLYRYLKHWPNLKGIAIVDPDLRSGKVFPIERRFFHGNMRLFGNYQDAMDWITELTKSTPTRKSSTEQLVHMK